jgi:hypothetical protein
VPGPCLSRRLRSPPFAGCRAPFACLPSPSS